MFFILAWHWIFCLQGTIFRVNMNKFVALLKYLPECKPFLASYDILELGSTVISCRGLKWGIDLSPRSEIGYGV